MGRDPASIISPVVSLFLPAQVQILTGSLIASSPFIYDSKPVTTTKFGCLWLPTRLARGGVREKTSSCMWRPHVRSVC